jgi:hypothetical protein
VTDRNARWRLGSGKLCHKPGSETTRHRSFYTNAIPENFLDDTDCPLVLGHKRFNLFSIILDPAGRRRSDFANQTQPAAPDSPTIKRYLAGPLVVYLNAPEPTTSVTWTYYILSISDKYDPAEA